MKSELHADPVMGHAKKGSTELRREKMHSDIAKYRGKSSSFRMARPKRKVLNRYA